MNYAQLLKIQRSIPEPTDDNVELDAIIAIALLEIAMQLSVVNEQMPIAGRGI